MSGPEFIVAIVAIGCATGLIKNWMDSRKNSSGVAEDKIDKLQRAFQKHKKEMQRRVQNLEAIIAEEDGGDSNEPDYRQIEASSSEGNLTNDLQQKDKVQS